ncbi:MAG: ABC transporter ATP-binding protein [Planctomycetes bacterium]|nr:ABC transporter ATP-binding protein [Planctomycetota bacterium]
MTPLIALVEITKTYQMGQVSVPVLRGISLAIERGELVAMMGTSGSGKSTLMNIVGCLDRPTSGQYRLEDQEVSQMSRRELAAIRNWKIGFCFQQFNLLRRTRAIDNVLMPLAYSKSELSNRECRERAEYLLTRVGLAERMDHEPTQLSGGQQQRVAIARALVNRPELLLADEPTGALDSRTAAEILELFQKLNEEEQITIVLVTHDAGVASSAKRTIKIRDGQIESAETNAHLLAAAR